MRLFLIRISTHAASLALLCIMVFGAAFVSRQFADHATGVASIWLANGVTLAALIRVRRLGAIPILAGAFLANVAANLLSGTSPADAAAFAAINIAEVALAGTLLARCAPQPFDIADWRALGPFLLFAGAVAPLSSATLAYGYLATTTAAPPTMLLFFHWLAADSIGMLVIAPLLLATPAQWKARLPSVQLLLFVAATAIVDSIVFQQSVSLLFLTLPLLIFAAFRLSLGETALVLATGSIIAIVFTISGSGPIAAANLHLSERIFVLQVYIAAMIIVTLPVSALIGQRNRLGQELLDSERDRREAAETLARSKSEFLATMSHEIRTPMTGVLGMIELLQTKPKADERDYFLATLKQSADLLMTVLDDVLDFSKIESGKLSFADSDFDLRQLANATIHLFANAASSKGILLTLSVKGAKRMIVRGDPIRLQQVMSNLLSNAIKFTDRGEVRLAISSRPDPAGPARRLFQIEVRDSGIGIEKTELTRLFEPFVQARSAESRASGGTGLGLAISHRLIELLGGQMGVESRLGEGSAFRVLLPLANGAMTETPAATSHPAIPARLGPPLDILVAEDNPINQMLINALLTRLDHRVTCVPNGRLAVEQAMKRRFDCILMDMQMPELDGLAATRQIRASGGPNARVAIIALTADAAPERRRFYDNAGLTDFLTKPVDRAALYRALEAIAVEPLVSQSKLVSLAALDLAQLGELEATIGLQKVQQLLDMACAELTARPAVMRNLAAADDIATLRQEAHSLKGAISNLGLAAAGNAAKAVELALPGADLEYSLDRLESEASRALIAVRDFRSDRPKRLAARA